MLFDYVSTHLGVVQMRTHVTPRVVASSFTKINFASSIEQQHDETQISSLGMRNEIKAEIPQSAAC